MGMNVKVVFPLEAMPKWPALKSSIDSVQTPLVVRMIDGQLAFPDETPTDNWRELRIGLPAGMITLQREEDGITLVIWGNADEKLQAATNAVATAIATMTGGSPVF